MEVQHLIYDDRTIAVALVRTVCGQLTFEHIAIRWLPPLSYIGKDGHSVATTNSMGGETDWFILPSSFGAAIGRILVQQHATGLPGFEADGFAALMRWLIENEEIEDAMCY